MIIGGASSPFEKVLRYVMMVYRQRWAILLFSVLGLVVGAALAAVVPEEFESGGTIMIEPQNTALVGRTTSQTIENRIQGIAEIIKSRSFCKRIIDGSPKLRSIVNVRDVREFQAGVEKLRISIRIGRPQPNLLRISYRGPDPDLAAEVATKIILQFEEDINQSLTQDLKGYIKFVDDLEKQYRQDIEIVQRQIVKFKEENIDSLPGTESNHLQRLESLKAELMQVELDLKSSAHLQRLIKAKIDATPEFIDDETTLSTSPEVLMQRLVVNDSIRRFEDVRARKTPLHPDYRVAEKALDEAKTELKRLEQEALNTVSEKKSTQNPAYLALLDRETDIDLQAEGNRARKANIEAAIEDLSQKVQSIPQLSSELQDMTTDLSSRVQLYTQVLQEQQRNDLAKAATESNQGTRFTHLDLPEPISKPVFPNPVLFVIGGLLGGLLLGAGVAFVREWFNQTVRTVEEVRSILAIPVLATVPQLEYLGEEAARLTDERRKKG